MSLLQSWLSAAGLDSLHPVFVAYGVNEASFVDLQFQDYDAMGIFEPPERQRLFKLIQSVKRQQQQMMQQAQQQQQQQHQQQQQQQQQQQLLLQQQQQQQQQQAAAAAAAAAQAAASA